MGFWGFGVLGIFMHTVGGVDGCLKDGTLHMGWVDMRTGEPVDVWQIREGNHEPCQRALLQ